MKCLHILTSYFLIFVLSVLLGTESFGQAGHFDLCEIQKTSSVSQESPQIIDSVVNKCAGQSHQDQGKDCSDPCHIGQIHFGHGSFPSGNIKVQYLSLSSALKLNQARLDVLDEPTLDGLRRPPRA